MEDHQPPALLCHRCARHAAHPGRFLPATRTAHQRRGNGKIPEPLDAINISQIAETTDLESMVRIGLLMDQLEKSNLEAARIVGYAYYFTGFTFEEIVEITAALSFGAGAPGVGKRPGLA